MPLSKHIVDREYEKFVADSNLDTAVRTVTEISTNFGVPPNADAFTVAYPNNTTEVYSFKEGGISGTVVATLTLTYANASKKELVSGAWT
jgi:hypothetical protein